MIGLRLVGGKNFYSGRLEVFYDGEWGTICDDGWSELSADVACRTLGFDGYATGYMPVKDVPLNNISVIWLSYVQCSGRESRFFECIEEEQWGVENCEHTEDVGVVCYFPPPADIPSLPLRVFCPDDYSGGNCTECGDAFLYDQSSCSSSPEVSGFVQVYYGGEWKFVDGSEWGEEEAFVFCGNIGYPRNFANPTAEKLLGCDPSTNASCLRSELKKELDSPIMYGLDCEGHESMLKDCFFTHWTQSTYIRNWKPGKYATVQCGFGPGQACNSTSKRPLQLRATPSPGVGRLEIADRFGWSTICGRYFNGPSANVACRQLGFGTAIAPSVRKYGSGNGAISDKLFQCTGMERYLDDCRQVTLEKPCDHMADAAVECYTPYTCDAREANSRIYDETDSSGRTTSFLQVYFNGKWGQVCGVGLTATQGGVICRSHRRQFFRGYRKAVSRSFVGPHYLGTMSCKGSEMNTNKCKLRYFDMRRCLQGLDVVVDCSDALPDLVPSMHSILSSLRRQSTLDRRRVSALACAIEENCLSSAANYYYNRGFGNFFFRYLLRFDVFVMNLGTQDFVPYLPRSEWEWHDCHNHYHSHTYFVFYELLFAKDLPKEREARFEFLYTGGRAAVEGHKASFCLQDSDCVLPGVNTFYACTSLNAFQGISVGCGDLYDGGLDCQWLDVTDAKRNEDYYLRVTINPRKISPELDFLNNVVVCLITLRDDRTIHVQSCESEFEVVCFVLSPP
jgi:lysyl oxidase-like protein 2/3/4